MKGWGGGLTRGELPPVCRSDVGAWADIQGGGGGADGRRQVNCRQGHQWVIHAHIGGLTRPRGQCTDKARGGGVHHLIPRRLPIPSRILPDAWDKCGDLPSGYRQPVGVHCQIHCALRLRHA